MARRGRDAKPKMKKELTEEEKKAKADLVAFQAEETRKKKIRARQDSIIQSMEAEQKISTFNMHNIHTEWRKIMRTINVEALHESVAKLADKYDHQLAVKKSAIERLGVRLMEADEQYQFSADNHSQSLSVLIDLHHTRVQIMERDFQSKLHRMEEAFSKERTFIITSHERNRKELRDMMAAMESEFQKALGDQKQDFESMREELKNKSTEEYNVAKISLESVVEDLEVSIQETHQTYLSSTEAKTISFKQMVKKDTVMARLIEQRMRKLIRLHELLAYWRARIATNSREWEASNRALRDEKDRINKHYQDLKKSLHKMHMSEHDKLKAISKASGEAFLSLTSKLELGRRLLKLGSLNKALETEYEKIFTYHPFGCSLFASIQEQRDNLKTFRESAFPNFATELILANTESRQKAPPIDNTNAQRTTSYAVDEDGIEVDEVNYFDNMNKRFNKVMLEKMAINLERKRLLEVNHQLQKQLEHYLDMSPTTKHKLKSTSLRAGEGCGEDWEGSKNILECLINFGSQGGSESGYILRLGRQ